MARRLTCNPWLAVAFLAACSDARSTREVSLRDSAGITITENTGTSSAVPVIHLATREARVIGRGATDADQLFRVVGAGRTAEGILVANGGTAELRRYSTDGELLSRSGGEGAGPGEFKRMNVMRRGPGDSLVVWDELNDRLSVFGPDGTFGRSVSLGILRDSLAPGSQIISMAGALADGVVAMVVVRQATALDRIVRDTAWIYRVAPDGLARSTGIRMLAREHLMRKEQAFRNLQVSWSPPYARSGVVRARGDRYVLYDGDPDAIMIYDTNARLRMIVRGGGGRRPLTSEQQKAFLADSIAEKAERTAGVWSKMVTDVGFPDSIPSFTQLHADGGGRIWAEWPRLPGEFETSLTVFDSTGRATARVVVDAPVTLLDAADDYLIVLERDNLGVETLRVIPHSIR